MSDKKEDINPVLLIGFGGSGLRTLEEFDKMVAAITKLREHRRNDIYYLGVDIDLSALTSFAESVMSRNVNADCPYLGERKGEREGPLVTAFHLMSGLNSFDEIVHPTFAPFYGNPTDPGLARLREHWWFDAEGRPYSGRLTVHGLQEVQWLNPPEVYGATWHGMRNLDRIVASIIDDIVRRGGIGSLSGLQVCFATSLVGGAGRGSWAPVMFKIKEILYNRYRQPIFTTGVFFDAGVFSDIARDCPRQALSHKICSLTGLSELSALMKNLTVDIPIQLPDMKFPADSSKDVLKMTGDIPSARTPVDRAFLICGESESSRGPLSCNADYHKMAGRGLYALLECPPIQARLVNQADRFNSFGVSAFGVDAAGLRAYFDCMARESFIDELISDEEEVEEQVSEFLNRIFLPTVIHREGGVRPDENGTLMQRACAKLLLCCKSRISDIRVKLRVSRSKDDCTEVRAMVQELLESASSTRNIDNAVTSAVMSVGTSFEGNTFDPQKELAHEVQLVYKGKPGGRPSLGRLFKFLRRLADRIAESESLSIKSFLLNDPFCPACRGLSPREWIDRYIQQFSKRTLREVVTGGMLFNSDEIHMLVDGGGISRAGVVPDSVLFEAYPKLRERFAEFFKPFCSLVHEMISACDRLLSACHDVRVMLMGDLQYKIGAGFADDPFQELFTTQDCIENDFMRLTDSRMIWRQLLRPIVKDRQELRELFRMRGKICCEKDFSGSILGTLYSEVRRQTHHAQPPNEVRNRKSDLSARFLDLVTRNVGVDESFLVQEFSLYSVLARNREHWNHMFKELFGSVSKDRFLAFCDRSRVSLGVAPELDDYDGVYKLPPVDDLLVAIVGSRISMCSPYCLLGPNVTYAYTSYVDVPLPEPNSHTREDMELIKKKFKMKLEDELMPWLANGKRFVQVLEQGTDGVPTDPYSVLVFAEEGIPEPKGDGLHVFDMIRAFDDGWKDRDIGKMLLKAEQPDGELIFSDFRPRGLGYISPRFVRDPQLSAMRWKPWASAKGESADS